MSHYIWWLVFLVAAAAVAAVVVIVRRRSSIRPQTVQVMLKDDDEAQVKDATAYAAAALKTRSHTQEQQSELLGKELKRLEQEGTQAFQQGDYDRARRRYLTLIGIARLAQDSVYELRALHNLGLTYSRQGAQQEAVRLLKLSCQLAASHKGIGQQVRALFSKNLAHIEERDVKLQAMRLYKEGLLAHEAEDVDGAWQKFEAAYSLAAKTSDGELQANILHSQAKICHQRRALDRGLELLQRARSAVRSAQLSETNPLVINIECNIQLFKDEKNSEACRKLINESGEYINAGKHVEAARRARLAYEAACRSVGNTHWLAALALDYEAVALMNQGEHWKAKPLLQAAAAIASEWPDTGAVVIKAVDEHLKRCREETEN